MSTSSARVVILRRGEAGSKDRTSEPITDAAEGTSISCMRDRRARRLPASRPLFIVLCSPQNDFTEGRKAELPRCRASARSEIHHHALGCGPHFRIVIAGIGDDFIDDGVRMVRIVVVEN
jgi:hypothetical protein